MGGCSSQSVTRSLVIALVAALVACSGGSGGGREGLPQDVPAHFVDPATDDRSEQAHPRRLAPRHPRPPLENTGTDYVAIFKSPIRNQRWISENPNPSPISDVSFRARRARQLRVSAYQYLVDNGYRWADEGYRLISVEVVSALPDAVTFRVVQAA